MIRDKAAVVSLFLLDDRWSLSVFKSISSHLIPKENSDSQPTIRKHMVSVVAEDTQAKDFPISLELDERIASYVLSYAFKMFQF